MLRFDIAPVCSNAHRIQAGFSFLLAAVYLFTPYGWVAVLLAFGGLLRGFVSPHKCPSFRLFSWATARLGWQKPANAGSLMFADKMAGIAGTAMAVTWFAGSWVGQIPAAAVLVFAFLAATTGFCIACWVYGAWYKWKTA